MTNLTPIVSQLLTETHSAPALRERRPSTETVDEFLKEAYRINSHITSLLRYLQSIRHSYLSTAPAPPAYQRRTPSSSSISSLKAQSQPHKHLTDEERDSIDSSTALLLRDLSSSIANLSSAETLRQETESTLLQKKYGHKNKLLWRWAGGSGALGGDEDQPRSKEQEHDEESARAIRAVRESVLWFLRRGLETVAEVQRGMVEKRIERVREKEKSVLYKMGSVRGDIPTRPQDGAGAAFDSNYMATSPIQREQGAAMSEAEVADIESQLSPEQLQLFEQENNTMLKHYEDTLSKVQNAEKSLLEISSLQQTLVTHLSTQEDYINQLVTDAQTTHANVGQGNKELKRATERRSTAQMVFWGTVGLCTYLVVWDLIF
ncbi:hypothetical protein Plec18167_001395 [Paecilomyces lecythidis]|uniref:t-SNARE coiled-coil homology domain-containing protein n=1 Tax=Paecilomyces lecythidis TaxID=3004212 RepID=A0ABR3YDM4_9EURO